MIRARVALLALTLAIPCTAFVASSPQNEESIFDRIRREHQWNRKYLHPQTSSSSVIASSIESQPVDIKHYRLQIQIAPEAPSISGTVTK